MRRGATTLAVTILTAAVAITATAAGGDPRGPSSPRLDPARVPWTRLELEARKLFAKARTEVRLRSAAGPELGRQLIASPRGAAIEPTGARLAVLETHAAFAGRESETSLWFDPLRGTALQRLKLRIGRKGYQKTYRFAGNGVFSRRRSAADRNQASVESWSRVEETFYDYPAGHRKCGSISEPSLVLYMLSAAGPETLRLCSFSDKSLHRVELQPRGTVQLDVDYTRTTAGENRRRRGRIDVDHIVLSARPVDTSSGEEFEFLGLEGDVDIYLDDRVPVEIAGRFPGLGRIRIKLVAADLG